MAIATLDGAAAGARQLAPMLKTAYTTAVTGRPLSLWGLAGVPGAGSYSGSLSGATLSSSDSGSLTRGNPASGNSYLHTLAGSCSVAGQLILIDRLWNNGGITISSNSPQTVNSVTWPSRCPTSATDDTPSTNGFQILIGVEVSAQTGSGTPTLTVGYTNSAGTASRTATNIIATTASTTASTFHPIGLQAGDQGVRSVQTFTLSATWTSGTINLVAYRVLASLAISTAGINQLDFLSGGAPRIYDSSCLSYLWIPTTTTGTNVYAMMTETQG